MFPFIWKTFQSENLFHWRICKKKFWPEARRQWKFCFRRVWKGLGHLDASWRDHRPADSARRLKRQTCDNVQQTRPVSLLWRNGRRCGKIWLCAPSFRPISEPMASGCGSDDRCCCPLSVNGSSGPLHRSSPWCSHRSTKEHTGSVCPSRWTGCCFEHDRWTRYFSHFFFSLAVNLRWSETRRHWNHFLWKV